jgi:hypothetical protein
MADVGLAILLTWHVISVILWLGSSSAFVLVVSPSLQTMESQQKEPLLFSLIPRFSKLLAISSISTVIAGTFLFGYVGSIDIIRSPSGWRLIFIIGGAVLGLVAVILTLGVLYPLSSKFVSARIVEMNSSIAGLRNQQQSTTVRSEEMLRAMISVVRAIFGMLSVILVLMTLGVFF